MIADRLRPAGSRITCPFCFRAFGAQEVKFRCVDRRCTGQEPDRVFAEATGRTPVAMGHVFPAPAGKKLFGPKVPVSARCDLCSRETMKRICPLCHFELSHDVGLLDNRIIAIIGGRQTGKSHYIVTLIHRLEHEVGANFQFGIRMLGDNTRTRFENDFRAPLYRRHTILDATQSAQVDSVIKTPMVFRLTLDGGRRREALDLSFFDTAGEDMTSFDVMSVEMRYITAAEGIIFLLDPLQIDAVRQQLPEADLPIADPQSEPTYIIDRLRDLFESQGLVSPTQKIAIPIAFTLSKLDALFPLIDPGSVLRRPGEHFGALNEAEVQSVHTEIWSYIETWAGPSFNSRVEQGFSNFRYFGVSALGQAPGADGRVDTVSSLRVEDPFLWIISQLDLIKSTRRAG